MSSITITTTHKMHTQRDIEEALLGSWSLLEYFSDPFDGKGPSLHPMGPDARGMLTYHPDGRMSVHLMPSAKMKSRTAVNDGFIYTGRYWVELQELGKNSFMVCHRAELASLPYLEGMVQRRKVTLPDNNRLVMSFVGIEELDVCGP
ncbi:uncharacterized protein BO97DRAFT_424196 [Aspergillus homomorphus CBS 101889]|uniref:Lipocalin-like domain-containing protein n=1 Tax=Aspergillus homomorphus (strain CBS 101889) TaxID=1450537 RepID=A0A395I065_ASPHC|nr:hypothetical protein BO97DRAFT_424196 [Aspergillus homomorphus CBS 101889]RAL13023.1 hypothetical protein BO97DRAFT_424196 [Aspergillus homomorphus CBS 101889]